jgi:hypothetical protein
MGWVTTFIQVKDFAHWACAEKRNGVQESEAFSATLEK